MAKANACDACGKVGGPAKVGSYFWLYEAAESEQELLRLCAPRNGDLCTECLIERLEIAIGCLKGTGSTYLLRHLDEHGGTWTDVGQK